MYVGVHRKSPPHLKFIDVLVAYHREPRTIVIITRRITGLPSLKDALEFFPLVVQGFVHAELAVLLTELPNVVARHHVDFGEQIRVELSAGRF